MAGWSSHLASPRVNCLYSRRQLSSCTDQYWKLYRIQCIDESSHRCLLFVFSPIGYYVAPETTDAVGWFNSMGTIQTRPSGTANQHYFHPFYHHRTLLFFLASQPWGDGKNDELVHRCLRWRYVIQHIFLVHTWAIGVHGSRHRSSQWLNSLGVTCFFFFFFNGTAWFSGCLI